jgi:hypothetical protein
MDAHDDGQTSAISIVRPSVTPLPMQADALTMTAAATASHHRIATIS